MAVFWGVLTVTVISVAPSPTGSMFATGSGDCRARIWRLVFYYYPQQDVVEDWLMTTV